MKCPNCGEENPVDSLFCQGCGSPLTEEQAEEVKEEPTAEKEQSEEPVKEEEQPEEIKETAKEEASGEQVQEPVKKEQPQPEASEKASKSKLGFAILGVAAIVVVVILVLLVKAVAGGLSSKNSTLKNNIYFFYNDEDEQTEVVVDSKKISDTIPNRIYDIQSSITGDSRVVSDSEGTLYYVSTSEVITIAEEVEEYVLATNGGAVAYIDDEGTLQLYTVSDNKKTKVDSDIEMDYMAISPDGKTLLYMKGDSDDCDLYYYYKSKKEKLGSDLYPVAVSNGASYIYAYSKDNDALYLLDTKGNKSKLGADMGSMYVLNKDHTELIFTADDKNYITIKGGEKVKIGSSYYMTVLMPRNGSYTYNYNNFSVITYGVSTFKGTLVANGDGDVYELNSDLETNRIVGNTYSMSNINNKTLFYVKNDNLYKISVEENAEAVKLAEDVTSFVVTSDGNSVYYITDDNELRYIKGTKDSKKIADDVSSLCISSKDVVFFLTDYAKNSGTLYYSKSGSEKKRIADDVYSISTTATSVFYFEDDGDDYYNVYSSNGSEKFEKVVENVEN